MGIFKKSWPPIKMYSTGKSSITLNNWLVNSFFFLIIYHTPLLVDNLFQKMILNDKNCRFCWFFKTILRIWNDFIFEQLPKQIETTYPFEMKNSIHYNHISLECFYCQSSKKEDIKTAHSFFLWMKWPNQSESYVPF